MRLLTVLFVMFLSSIQVQAITILVPTEQPTIQAGIDVALEGDTVLVAQGTYTGEGNRDLIFNGVNLVLKSEMGAEVTIIDCQGTYEDPHLAIYLDNSEDSTSKIEGFTFTNAFSSVGRSGAITFWSGVANINDCIFTNNILYGVDVNPGINSCTIQNSIFKNNRIGLASERASTVIRDCEFANNNEGITFSAETEIYNSLFTHNAGNAIAHYTDFNVPPILIDHCTIVFNAAGLQYAFLAPRVSEFENQIESITIRNSIIAYNTYAGITTHFASYIPYNCEYSNVFGNGDHNWQEDRFSDGDEFGNLSVDPLFCDTVVNNYFLGENSPCASDNNFSGSTIGAFEVGCSCCVGIRGNLDADPADIVDISDLVHMVDCMFFTDCTNVCIEEYDVNADGTFDISDLVYLVDFMFTGGPFPQPCY